ncbi:MAG: hypothetical protein DBX47_03420 [Clostridiales bacterium]|nr:MAG: hypothetical protein DBX47_03420 [Clostridiales bacterium]
MMMMDRLIEQFKADGADVSTIVEMNAGGEFVRKNLRAFPEAKWTYSVSKNYTATAIGILYDRNIISDEDYIYPMFKELFTPSHDPKWETVKIKDLLQHRSGFARGYLNYKDEDDSLFQVDDPLRIMFAYPLAGTVGETMVYTDPNYYLLSRIVELKTGMTLYEFVRREILVPMKCLDHSWACCPKGHTLGGDGLIIRTEDMAKLGCVFLNGGIYKGKRYLSEDWIKKATATRTVDELGEYGYSILRKSSAKENYYFQGAYGQLVNIMPRTKRIIAYHSVGANNNAYIDLLKQWEDEELAEQK